MAVLDVVSSNEIDVEALPLSEDIAGSCCCCCCCACIACEIEH